MALLSFNASRGFNYSGQHSFPVWAFGPRLDPRLREDDVIRGRALLLQQRGWP